MDQGDKSGESIASLVLANQIEASSENQPDDHYCIHELFESASAEFGDKLAVVFDTKKLTYRELNEQSNNFANLLIASGVSSNSVVGICMERSIGMVVAMLGVLKAGAAYLPLNPELPVERIHLCLSDANSTHVVIQSIIANKFIDLDLNLICIDPNRISCEISELLNCTQKHQAIRVSSRSLAYVIFTSGSTGRPKGVMVEHRALVNRILWMKDEYQCNSSDIVLQKTPFNFDVSVWEFFLPLVAGACLVIAKPGGHKDPFYLATIIRQQQVTIIHFVPSMLSAFLACNKLAECDSLKKVFCSGESLLPSQVGDFFNQLPKIELHNLYGPTEATIEVSHWQCSASDKQRKYVPIGKSIKNVELHILDQDYQVVTEGIIGELYIGGVSLARGYLNLPEQTAESFVFLSVSGKPPKRLYKTGDLCRYLPDGNIEYIGRNDNQIKLNGNRIELSEIEVLLCRHEEIHGAVVILKGSAFGKKLAAFVAASNGLAEASIKSYLERLLPQYMIPSCYVLMSELPLTTNGKIDRQQLADSATRLDAGALYVSPNSKCEKKLVAIWSEVLKLDQKDIGVDHDFFSIGGNSILAIQLLRAIEEELKVSISISDASNNFTIRSMAANLKDKKRLNNKQEKHIYASIYRQASSKHRRSLSNSEKWYLDRFLLNPEIEKRAILSVSLQFDKDADMRLVTDAFETIFANSDVFSATYNSENNNCSQVNVDDGYMDKLRGEIAKFDLVDNEDQIISAISEHINAGFNVIMGLPWKILRYKNISNGVTVISLLMHHIISDDDSENIFFNKLQAILSGKYNYTDGIPYSTYLEFLKTRNNRKISDYWRNELSEAPICLSINDRERPKMHTGKLSHHAFIIDEDQYVKITLMAGRYKCSKFAILTCAIASAFKLHTGNSEFLIGTPFSNRADAKLMSTMGVMVSSIIMRFRLGWWKSKETLINNLSRTLMNCIEHQPIMLDELHRYVGPQTGGGYFWPEQLFINYRTRKKLDRPTDCYVTQFDLTKKLENAKAKYDLATEIFDTGKTLEITFEYYCEVLLEADILIFERLFKDFFD